ncbi:MAG: anthranilate synthase component ii [Bacteroidetes bacterium]|nr:MAG: anthranilate synthase component ii [Bacteroidota bacterium]
MKLLVFDNYDSFTYNLVHMIEKNTGIEPDVFRNDKIPLDKIADYDKILLSPGPGLPSESGILIELIKTYASTKSIFGVCLGLQAMAEAFGGNLENLESVYHGVATDVRVTDSNELLFKNMAAVFQAGRYHSWVAEKYSLPDCFKITAESDDGLIMGIRHKQFDLSAVQFHPESILTTNGEKILTNWLNQTT